MANDNIPVKEIGELLSEVTDKVPALITGLVKSLYSADTGRNMGQAVGTFYQELIAAGIPKETAVQMAKDYMLSIREVTQSFSGAQKDGHQKSWNGDDSNNEAAQ